eukprot:4700710-Pyramimonas_sp.AAC.1
MAERGNRRAVNGHGGEVSRESQPQGGAPAVPRAAIGAFCRHQCFQRAAASVIVPQIIIQRE